MERYRFVDPGDSLLAHHLDRVHLTQQELLPTAVGGGLGHQGAGPVGFVGPLEAGGEVHGVAQHGVVEAAVGAQVAHQGHASVQADAHLQARQVTRRPPLRELGHRVLATDGSSARTHGVIGLGQGRTEHRHRGVADVLVDGPALFQDDGAHGSQAFVEQLHEGGRIELFGQRGEPLDIGEEGGDLGALSPQAQAVRVGDQLVHHGRREIVCERTPHSPSPAPGVHATPKLVGQAHRQPERCPTPHRQGRQHPTPAQRQQRHGPPEQARAARGRQQA